MTNPCKATIEMAGVTITIEGSESLVDRYVKLYSSSTISRGAESKGPQPDRNDSAERAAMTTETELIAQKEPKGHPETVAVLAFGLKEEGQEEFTEDDIRRAYVRARVRPPKVVAQAIRDAKNGFDYVETGSKRGSYKLSHHGDRTVRFDLPRKGK
jgi:hypothetical protein